MKRKTTWIVCAIAAAACAAALSSAASAAPPQEWDGLELRKAKGIDAVYVRPGVEFKAYRTLTLDPVHVAFDKDWDPNRSTRSLSRRLSSDDLQRIREEMASQFREVFSKELAAAGYAVVAKVEDDTLDVAVALADVYLNAPDTQSAGRGNTYSVGAGRMTLVMELRDGPTGQLLARVVDRYQSRDAGYMQIANSVSNSAEFRRAVTDWAKRLVKGLDRLNGKED